ncbi:BTAD domain-containing putative transcriptional regulator [Plantactinospora soyae]|uniref:DNA-binding SARP family transcriptional activator n=1 Tax=Plantactinospora soyae TaxID=1544732 RepID=A0A927MAZ1_9ACTN|nr:BTAD domain-containing putative transcriptional regulator [Plantactinospora soyae]MBE1491104.1 DNA-binding SARP family transcriptional activator [Plantactinospora soyae]
MRTSSLPPSIRPGSPVRPRPERRQWSAIPGRRCTFVVAAAGYGKTTTVRRLLARASSRWCTPAESSAIFDVDAVEEPDVHLAELLRSTGDDPGHDLWLVLDDIGQLPGARLRAVLAAARRLPERVRLMILTRSPPASALIGGGCRRGELGVLGPVDLALSCPEVTDLLREQYDLADPALARTVHRATAGWPALVHLLAQCHRDGGGHDGAPSSLPGAVAWAEAYLVSEVFPELPAGAARLLRQAARLDPAHPELVAGADPRRTGRLLRWLAAVGLFGRERPDGTGYPAIPVVAGAVHRHLPMPPAQVTVLRVRAADWYAGHGLPAAALRGYQEAGRVDSVAQVLRGSGVRLLADGESAVVAAAVEALPAALRAPLRQLRADALRMVGEADSALEIYRALAGRRAGLPPALAWRYGLVYLLRGEPLAAIGVFEQASTGTGRTVDEALLLGWAGCAYALAGNVGTARDRARQALAVAAAPVPGTPVRPPGPASSSRRGTAAVPPGSGRTPTSPGQPTPISGSDLTVVQASVTAGVAAGLTARLTGDRSAVFGQLTEAVRLADTVGDLGLAAWARINLAAARAGVAGYREAVTEAAEAVELAEVSGQPPMLALALAVRGAGLARLGRLDEATADYERSVAVQQRIGSGNIAAPLIGLGQLHLLRGRDSLARAAYEEAVRVSEPCGNVFALVPALAGLAMVIARENLSAATALAERAVELARGPHAIVARSALGWVAMAVPDLPRAARLAAEVEEQARLHQDRAGLAEALRLRAAAEPRFARPALLEAGAILREIGAQIEADRVCVLIGRLPGAGAVDRIDARVAAARLAEADVVVPAPAGQPGLPATVAVRTLGRFEVRVDGHPVPTSAWQSRKARDLLRILAARRGRPVSREQLAELLWPDEEPGRVGHRLSVLLSLLRGVLDPHRRGPVDRYVVAERTSVALDVEQVELDVELFQAEALLGLRRFERGETSPAQDILCLAEQRYQGDFLVDDPYDDWAVPVRDEMRRLYLRVIRALAELARHRGDQEQAAHQLRRALEVEPYDERTHEELISVLTSAGRYGEADEAYRRYRRAMAVLGVPARLAR